MRFEFKIKSCRVILLWIFLILLSACTGPMPGVNQAEDETASGDAQQVELPRRNVEGPAPEFEPGYARFSLLQEVRSPFFAAPLSGWLTSFTHLQGWVIGLSLLISLLIAFDFRKVISAHNFDLLLLLLPAVFLVDLIPLGFEGNDLPQVALFRLLYLGLFTATLLLFVRSLVRSFTWGDTGWMPNLAEKVLLFIVVLLLFLNIFLTLTRDPDDAGYYSNIGAYNLIKTGHFPYGEESLRGGAAATYGPYLYLSHVPIQLIVNPLLDRVDIGFNPGLGRMLIGAQGLQDDLPPVIATKLAVIVFLLLGTVCLYWIGREMASAALGLSLAALYLGSPYLLGLGGQEYFITGVAYISHIAPGAVTLLAFALIRRPLLSGMCLAFAAGMLYYPLFLFPLWIGYYFWKRSGWVKFAAGFLLMTALALLLALLFTRPGSDENVFRIIYESTVGHQESREYYGASTFSFWGTQPALSAVWQHQFVEGLYLLRPSFILFSLFIGLSFFFARNRTLSQFAMLTASVVIAVQFWKSHAGGTYVEWYYPFFLIGLLANQVVRSSTENPAKTAVSVPLDDS